MLSLMLIKWNNLGKKREIFLFRINNYRNIVNFWLREDTRIFKNYFYTLQ